MELSRENTKAACLFTVHLFTVRLIQSLYTSVGPHKRRQRTVPCLLEVPYSLTYTYPSMILLAVLSRLPERTVWVPSGLSCRSA